MAGGLQKILGVLAVSGLNESTLFDAFDEISRKDPRSLVENVIQLRRFLDQDLGVPKSKIISQSVQKERSNSKGAEALIVALQHDAGLSQMQIVEEITRRLESRGRKSLPTFRPKDGIKKWTARVEKAVGASEFLYALNNAALSKIDSPRSAWTLKPR